MAVAFVDYKCKSKRVKGLVINLASIGSLRERTATSTRTAENNKLKVTVQFETEGNGQNEIFSHMDRSKVKL